MSVTFRWDPAKARVNLKKHGVSFDEAMSAFTDPLSRTISDPDHSYDEERFILLGSSQQNRLLVVIHVDMDDTIRIISAREADRYERRNYEQGPAK
jgi:uncharacterized DUF497 family protein